MNKRIISYIIIGIAFIFIGYFSLKFEDNKKQQPNEEISVVVAQWGQEKYLIYLPLYLAQEKGFFEKEGLNVSTKYSGNDDQVFATVLRGEAQFGIGDPVFTAISREKGARGKVVALIVNGVALWGITKNQNLPIIKESSQLAGLRIGTFPKPSTTYTLVKNTIEQEGEKLKNTKIVEASFGSQIALLESNSADIAMDLEPGASIAESKGYKIVYSLPKFYGDFSFTGLTTTEEVIKTSSETVQKMVNALEKACRFAHNNIEETIAIAQTLFPTQDKKIITNAVNRMIDENTIPEHAFISTEGWNRAIKVRVEVGDLKSEKNSEKSLDNSFAEKARQQR